jgi:hypothetical protein
VDVINEYSQNGGEMKQICKEHKREECLPCFSKRPCQCKEDIPRHTEDFHYQAMTPRKAVTAESIALKLGAVLDEQNIGISDREWKVFTQELAEQIKLAQEEAYKKGLTEAAKSKQCPTCFEAYTRGRQEQREEDAKIAENYDATEVYKAIMSDPTKMYRPIRKGIAERIRSGGKQ